MSNDVNHVHAPAVTDRPSAPAQAESNCTKPPSGSALCVPCALSRLIRGPFRPLLPLANNLAANPTLRRYLKFGLVGGSGVIVDMAILFLLADPRTFHLNLSLSKTIAAEVAIINNFAWNDLWTFRDRSAARPGVRALLQRLLKFNVVCLAGVVLNVLLLNVAVRLVHIDLYVANLIVILIVSVWNFALNLRFAWRRPNPGTKAAAPCGSDEACASAARHAGDEIQANPRNLNPTQQENA